MQITNPSIGDLDFYDRSWKQHTTNLTFSTHRWINNSERYGYYYKVEGKTRGSTSKQPITDKDIYDHYSGSAVIGLHTGEFKNQSAKWVCMDIDQHKTAEEFITGLAYECKKIQCLSKAQQIAKYLDAHEFQYLIEDSNGMGGLHIWIPFFATITLQEAYDFGQHLAHKFDVAEAFPKQPNLPKQSSCGNWVRLPGHHHTLDHWSRFYDAQDKIWLDNDQSATAWINIKDNKSSRLRQFLKLIVKSDKQTTKPEPTVATHSSTKANYSDANKSQGKLIVKRYLERIGVSHIDNGDEYVIDCPWQSQHTTDTDHSLAIYCNDGAIGVHCFHAHCQQRKWRDVWQSLGSVVASDFDKPFVATQNAPATKTSNQTIPTYTTQELVHLASSDAPAIWDNILLRGSMSLLSGEPKAGKSTFLDTLVRHFDQGTEFFEKTQKSSVLYLTEESEPVLKKRLEDHDITDVENVTWVPCRQYRLAEFITYLNNLATQQNNFEDIDLVVIDTLTNIVLISDENSNSLLSELLNTIKTFFKSYPNIALLIVHHMGKPGKEKRNAVNRIRGASAIGQVFDMLIGLERANPQDLADRRRVVTFLGRSNPKSPLIFVELDKSTMQYKVVDVGIPHEEVGSVDGMVNLIEQHDSLRVAEIVNKLGLPRSSVNRLLRDAVNQHRIMRFGTGKKGEPFVYSVNSAVPLGSTKRH